MLALQIFVTRRPIRLFCWYLKALRWRSSMPDWDSNTYRYCVVLVPPEQQTLLRFHRKHSTCLVSPNIFTSASNDRPMVYVCLHCWVITSRCFSIRETVVAVRTKQNLLIRNRARHVFQMRIPLLTFFVSLLTISRNTKT